MNKTQKLKEVISEYVDFHWCDYGEGCEDCITHAEFGLDDILIALEKVKNEKPERIIKATNYNDENIVIDTEGNILTLPWGEAHETFKVWILGQPLENQSEETKQFLFEILCD